MARTVADMLVGTRGDCGWFTTTLGPADPDHPYHIHFDILRHGAFASSTPLLWLLSHLMQFWPAPVCDGMLGLQLQRVCQPQETLPPREV